METDKLLNIADTFMEISGEVILKRRQGYFLDLYMIDDEHKSFLRSLVSLSVSLNSSFDILPKININATDIPLSDALGRVFYYILEGNTKLAKKELHKLPHYLQVIISFVLTNKIISQVTHEFIFGLLEDLETMPQLLTGFVKLPESLGQDIFLEKDVCFSSSNELTLPFYIVKRAKAQRTRGKLFYITKDNMGVTSNIPNKLVKDYLAKQCKLHKYGLIISMVFNKKKSRIKYVQVISFSEDSKAIKDYFKGKGDLNKVGKLKFWDYFKEAPQTVEVMQKQPILIEDIVELIDNPYTLLNGNLSLHSNGISIIQNKSYKVKGKVVDWLLSQDYEPLGYKVLVDGVVYNVRCFISNEEVDEGIEELYLNLKQTKFMGKIVKMEFFAKLSNKYRQCALCGVVENLTHSGLCYPCFAKLLKVASSATLDRFEYDLVEPFKAGHTLSLHKYDLVFSEVSVGFTENLGLVKGRQLSLPYAWWEREEWKWVSYRACKSD